MTRTGGGFTRISPEGAAGRYVETNVTDMFTRQKMVAALPGAPAGSSVYFIQRRQYNGAIKIGRARNPMARLRDLQVGSEVHLDLLAIEPGGATRERELHERFSRHRLSGEWFSPAPTILAYIRALPQQFGPQRSIEELRDAR